jgi:hypothetical protein
VPLSYQHQHQSSRPDGKCLFTVEEFERVFNEVIIF